MPSFIKPEESNKPFVVDVWEYEAGWGSKVDFMRGFDTKEEGDAYVKEFNSKNTAKEVPDWYMVARATY